MTGRVLREENIQSPINNTIDLKNISSGMVVVEYISG